MFRLQKYFFKKKKKKKRKRIFTYYCHRAPNEAGGLHPHVVLAG
jgi:hypothetical protein